MNNSSLLIEATNLRKCFGDFVAVDEISFTVDKGLCFGILGPNGAGKTSTIRMIYGASPVTSGDLFVFGLDVKTSASIIKARIGVCQQENTLDPDLTVMQNFEVFSRYFNIDKKTARKRALELLKFLALEQRQNARVTELSGGMIRRLIIARALINRPELIILDEPTTGLDPQSRHQVWERLETLKAQGITILLTTHYMDEAQRLCDRLLIVDNGKILAQGSPQSLVSDYTGSYIIEATAPAEDMRMFARTQGIHREDLGHRLIMYTQDGPELYREVCHRFSSEGCILRTATLEDVFLQLTGRELKE
jgi:lipooligosaccharide transport system ATP-binding protein